MPSKNLSNKESNKMNLWQNALIWRENLPIKCPRHRHFSERGSQKPPLKHKLSSQASAALMGMKLTGADGLEAVKADLVRLPTILPFPFPFPAVELKFRSMGRLASLVNWRTWNKEKIVKLVNLEQPWTGAVWEPPPTLAAELKFYSMAMGRLASLVNWRTCG